MYKKIISLAAAALLTSSCLAAPISAETFYNSTPAVMSGNSWIAPCYDNVATVTAGISISSSYYYCTYVQVQIYNSRNEVIETVTSLSPVTHL